MANVEVVQDKDLMIYGTRTCSQCRTPHDKRFHLKETWKSRFLLLQFAGELMAPKKSNLPKWTEMATKAEKLKALRSMRNGVPLYDSTKTATAGGPDIRKQVVEALKSLHQLGYDWLNAEDLHAFINPAELDSKGAFKKDLTLDKFRNVLATMEKSGNVQVDGSGAAKTYRLADVGGPPAKVDPSYDDRDAFRRGLLDAVTSSKSGQCMLGILICPEQIFISASGAGMKIGDFKTIAERRGFTICKERTADTAPRRTIFGDPISREVYVASKADGASEPGNCAAPRLIQMATEEPSVDTERFQEWQMSEVMYLPITSARTREQSGGLVWTHGLTMHSCETCQNLVPILMCPGRRNFPHIDLPGGTA
jgi:hypothetical protein